jgi:hypothetical protein
MLSSGLLRADRNVGLFLIRDFSTLYYEFLKQMEGKEDYQLSNYFILLLLAFHMDGEKPEYNEWGRALQTS